LNKTAAPATTTTTKVLTKKKTASAGLFDDDESDAVSTRVLHLRDCYFTPLGVDVI
jgi:hypothetical protein